MKVFTHHPALAPAIRRAGYEPALLEPLEIVRGPVAVEAFMDTVAVSTGFGTALVFEKDPGNFGCWRMVP